MSTERSQNLPFVVEAREHLAGMVSGLMALEREQGDPRPLFEQLLRAAHSIKGGAGFTGRMRIEQLAHALETALECLRDRSAALTGDVIDTLLSATDRLGAMVDDLDHSDDTDVSDLLARMRPLVDASTGTAAPALPLAAPRPAPSRLARSVAQPGEFPLSERVLAARQPKAACLYGVKLDWFECERDYGLAPLEVARRLEQAGGVLDSRMDVADPHLAEGLPGAPLWYRAIIASALKPEQFAQQLGIPCAAIVRLECVDNTPPPGSRPVSGAAQRPAPAATSLRIPIPLIDRMMRLAGELVLVRNQAVHLSAPAEVQLRQLMRRLDSVTNELQDAALRMRMQPVGTLFDRFPRLVRDLARQLGKQIDIRISGAEVELDKTILELLSDPLTHLVRNCCDHGIEMPDVRTGAGKPPAGTVDLSARQQGGRILIQIRDDGRGLDREAIERKALERGVRTRQELEQLSQQQIFGLILLSGFSTAAQVTDLSGRGVGMDVVKTNIEQIGGVLEIDSAPGTGTVFTLSLPLTLAIVPCLLLQSGGRAYALPQRDVEEIVLVDPGAGRARIECSHDEEMLRLRGRLLPVVRLDEIFRSRQPFTRQTWSQIVAAYHPRTVDRQCYVAVIKFGSQRFGLVVDDLLGSEDIVVMPLHPLLRPLGIYGGTTILGDGCVALILSGEGIARHSGIAYRPQVAEAPALPLPSEDVDTHTLMLFKCGPAELLAVPIETVQRVVTIEPGQIQRVGDRELANIDGRAVNVLRLDRLLSLSPCPTGSVLHLVLPRDAGHVGLLASEIADTPTLPVAIDTQAYRAAGVLGSVLIRGEVVLLLDMDAILALWDQAARPAPPALPAGSGKRVLVVEDTQFFRELIKSQLESAGHDVTVAFNGREGLERLGEAEFDLVVSDIEMPVMDGLEMARQIRKDPRHASVPLLAVTTLSGEEHRARALACGFDAFEVKLDRQSFLACVEQLLRPAGTSSLLPGGSDHE